MGGVLVGVQEADGDGASSGAGEFGGEALQGRSGGRAEHGAIEEHAFVETEAEGSVDQGMAGGGGEVVELGSILAADFEEVFEAGGGNEGGTSAFALQQDVGGDGRAMNDLDWLFLQRASGAR